MNKKNKEFLILKIAYNKLDDENRKNSKLVQEIIDDYDKSRREGGADSNSIKKLKEVRFNDIV
jgi:hypothetical protein